MRALLDLYRKRIAVAEARARYLGHCVAHERLKEWLRLHEHKGTPDTCWVIAQLDVVRNEEARYRKRWREVRDEQ